MNIILGASGQVGSNIVKELTNKNSPVRAVVRNQNFDFDNNVEVRTANFFNQVALTEALERGTTIFILTPENPSSNDIIGETKQIIDNYKQAIRATGIKKIVGLSCVGAHIKDKTGNILMSRMLENGFDDLDIEKIFIRPSYYFSNWLNFLGVAEQQGILPTFFPENLQIDMNSPIDVAKFVAETIITNYQSKKKKIFELVGTKKYSSQDVAVTFSKLLNKNIEAQSIPKEKWKETLLSVGFTENTTANLIDMTQAVIDNIVFPENKKQTIELSTTLYEYMKEQLKRLKKLPQTPDV